MYEHVRTMDDSIDTASYRQPVLGTISHFHPPLLGRTVLRLSEQSIC